MAITAASPLFSWWTLCVCVWEQYTSPDDLRCGREADSRHQTDFSSKPLSSTQKSYAFLMEPELWCCRIYCCSVCEVMWDITCVMLLIPQQDRHGRATLIFKRQRELILIFLHHLGAHVGPQVWGSCQTGFSACWKSGLETLIVMGKHLCQIENIGLIFGGLK